MIITFQNILLNLDLFIWSRCYKEDITRLTKKINPSLSMYGGPITYKADLHFNTLGLFF